MSTLRLPHCEHTSLSRQSSIDGAGAALRGGIGLDLVATIPAPYDEPHAGRGGTAERHRRPGLGFTRDAVAWPLSRAGGGKGSRPGCGSSLARGCPVRCGSTATTRSAATVLLRQGQRVDGARFGIVGEPTP